MYILGINAFHGDSSACLLADGQLVAAVEEERFRRQKHWAGFPSNAIRYCLDTAAIGISQVDRVAVNQDPKANLSKRLSYLLTHRPNPALVYDRLRNKRKRSGILELLASEFPGQTIRAVYQPVEHHMAHLSSAFHCSPFERATTVSVDGFGDFASSAWGVGTGSSIKVEDKVYFPHSLGIFYQALTQFLGFTNYGDEYKVMGLASYGQPRFMAQMRKIVLLEGDGSFRLNLDYFEHHRKKISYKWEGGSPVVGPLFSPNLSELLGPPRNSDEHLTENHKDLAHSVQAMYEEAFFHLLRSLHKKHGSDSLAIAGGCGMNSVANGRIRKCTPFRNIYVQAAAGDAGGALGAAYSAWHSLGNHQRVPMKHAFWGPEFSDKQYRDMLNAEDRSLQSSGCAVTRHQHETDLCEAVVGRIMDGGVVGWFQGRMEWGPRALGNRSILCDPRRTDMQDILNLKIKRRESFRPFAPSVLREHVANWFEDDDDVPFMMKVYPVRKEKRDIVPAITHVDGTGRLQTVHKAVSPLYWRLIYTFWEKTGVPMLLNTSFNENEPIVCTPQEAMDCFKRTKMDMLVLGSWTIARLN